MDLGVRQIRTSGKGSGSIEVTLPAGLRDLVGSPCRIILRDGSRPEIVLQPDLRHAHLAFKTIWHAMAAAVLAEDVSPLALPLGQFAFGLQPREAGGDMPYLCWRDGLALAATAPHDPSAVSRTLAAFGQALAARLHIDTQLATGFGAACGYIVSGVAATADGQEACDIAAGALRREHPELVRMPAGAAAADACAAGIMAEPFWRHAEPLLAATAELFVGWTGDPPGHSNLRAAWWRGRTIEMSGD